MQFGEVKKFILGKLKKELPKHLSYHSVEHVKDVYNSAKEIAKREGVSGDDLKLILTAALFHDSGFLTDQNQHEKQSCVIAKETPVMELGRGITIYKGERGFLKDSFDVSQPCDIVFTIATRLEVRRLKNIVHNIDPKAFIFTNSIKEATRGVLKQRAGDHHHHH